MRRIASAFAGRSSVAAPVAVRYCSAKPTPSGDSNKKLEEMSSLYSQLTLKELSELQRLVFKKLGYSDEFYEKALLRGLGGGGGGGAVVMAAATPIAAAAVDPAAADAAAAAAAPKEKKKVEKTTFDVKLDKYTPDIKVKLIKELRTVTSLSIMDAKLAIEKCPGLIAQNMGKDDAEKLKAAFEKLGAKVELV